MPPKLIHLKEMGMCSKDLGIGNNGLGETSQFSIW